MASPAKSSTLANFLLLERGTPNGCLATLGSLRPVSDGTYVRPAQVREGQAATEAWGLLMRLFHGQRRRFMAIAQEFELAPQQTHRSFRAALAAWIDDFARAEGLTLLRPLADADWR